MAKNTKSIVVGSIGIVLIINVLCGIASACSYVPKPIAAFNYDEYVFIGKVVGYTEPVEFTERHPSRGAWTPYNVAQGLIVAKSTEFFLPDESFLSTKTADSTKANLEVFPFTSDGSCAPMGLSESELSRRFPLNAEVAVIAEKARFPSQSSSGNIRLEIRVVTGALAVVPPEYSSRSSDSIIDYKELTYTDSGTQRAIAKIEIRKDLLRLERSSFYDHKRTILNRLLYVPNSLFILDYSAVTIAHTKSEKESTDLVRKKLEIEGWSKERIEKFFELKGKKSRK